jgi:hypothetical protein
MDDADLKFVTALVDLVKAVVWPAVVVWLVLRFRVHVSHLLARLASLKVGGSEFVFQQPSDGPSMAASPTPRGDIRTGADGFLTVDSLRAVVRDTLVLDQRETPVGELLFFQTPKQRTWLIATTNRVCVILDDQQTRRTGSLVQTVFGLEEALPLSFSESDGSGTVKFAAEDTWWYYSRQLFPTTRALAKAVRRLVGMTA